MKFLDLDLIKAQLRLDDAQATAEQSLLEIDGQTAEDIVCKHLRRTYDELIEDYGEVPSPIVKAALLLVDTSYQYRCPVSQTSLSLVPYTFDFLLKPFMKLSSNCCHE